jgi:tRNA (cytidine/uridine-2'-O-)-methyltransferase
MDVVLVNPQIPQNTGSIARTCAATQTPLHLVGKLGFDLSEKAVRRAGLDYWPHVPLTRHQSWEEYLAARYPKTGEKIVVPPKRLPFWKTGQELKQRVDSAFS